MSDSFGGNTAYAYDPVDRLTQITTPQNEVFTQSYDLAGRMLGRIAPNTTVTDRTYEDGTGRLMSQTQAASDTAFNGFTYDYTDRGNIAEIAETGTLARTKHYSYDELERLTEVDVPEAPTEDESYTLDPEGNRITSQLSANHETDVANRLTGDDAYSYIYDLNGNELTHPSSTHPTLLGSLRHTQPFCRYKLDNLKPIYLLRAQRKYLHHNLHIRSTMM